MTTSATPPDDIIELTDIVAEGTPLDQDFANFAMDRAVDAKSLDQELDDLLREPGLSATPIKPEEPGIDFDAIFDETADVPPADPSARKGDAVDLSDLDDLFESLDMAQESEDRTSLDLILDGDSPRPDASRPAAETPAVPSMDLDLDLPGVGADGDPDIQELTEDLLADIPETVLGQPAPAASIPAAVLPDPESLDLSGIPLPGEVLDSAAIPAAAADVPAPDVSRDEVEALLARLETLREEIGQELDSRLSAMDPAASLLALRQALDETRSRIEALEIRPTQEIGPSQILAMLPESPADLPLALNLREEILAKVQALLSGQPTATDLDEVRQSVGALRDHIETLNDQAATPSAPDTETELAALRTLVQNQERTIIGLQEDLAAKNVVIDELRSAGLGLRQEMDALTSRVAPPLDVTALKNELRAMIEQQVPVAAAKVIREEIQALLKEMGA
jgi:hypothetical protein